jgi:hypothetical protein
VACASVLSPEPECRPASPFRSAISRRKAARVQGAVATPRWGGVAMGPVRRRAAERAGRPRMRSPGRPPVGRREHRQRFWLAIARGVSSEEAAAAARGCHRRWASGGSERVAGCRRSACVRCQVATCRSASAKRSRCFARAARECGRSRGSFGVRRRRSRASCAETPRPAAAGSSTGRRPRSGTPTGVLGGRSRPSWPRTRRCGGTCRSGSRGR